MRRGGANVGSSGRADSAVEMPLLPLLAQMRFHINAQ